MKLIYILLILFLLSAGTGSASYLENYTVNETFLGGQPSKGIAYDGKQIEWNSYGQPIRIDGEITLVLMMYQDYNANDIYSYRDLNGEIVSYSDRLIKTDPDKLTGWSRYSIASNKTPLAYPPYEQASLNAKQYQEKYGVSRDYLQNESNYQIVYDNLYKRTPDYLMDENIKLKQDIEQHGTWLESIRVFINQTFGVSLW